MDKIEITISLEVPNKYRNDIGTYKEYAVKKLDRHILYVVATYLDNVEYKITSKVQDE